MAIIQFGHTWWGGKWLESLSHIDYSNRLPRGQRYARNGSVVSINIDDGIVSARVAGTRSKPYSVRLKPWKFTKKEKQVVTDLILGSPYYLSQLEARVLPPELFDVLTQLGLPLFPSSWKELPMSCSCPDWAVPCKHIASVIYIIANEIDKDPFLVFKLHGFDLMGLLHTNNTLSESIPMLSSFCSSEEQSYILDESAFSSIDFSSIPNIGDAVSGILTENPLFYPKRDFKAIFNSSMGKLSKAVLKRLQDSEISEEIPDVLYSSGKFKILTGKKMVSGVLRQGRNTVTFSSEDPAPLISSIEKLPAVNLSSYPSLTAFLVMVHSFTIKLIVQQALIPDIYGISGSSCRIRWIPALFNAEVLSIFDILVSGLPAELVTYKGTSLIKREQLLMIISFIAEYYISESNLIKEKDLDSINSMFFLGGLYRPTRFEERGNIKVIHLWLGRFLIRPSHLIPILHIEEYKDEGRMEQENRDSSYRFEILVQDTRSQDVRSSDSLPLFSVISDIDAESMALLRDLNLLSTYLPIVNVYLKAGGAVTVDEETFVESWFAALGALQTLGVKTSVPKILQKSLIPQLTLSFKKKAGVSCDNVTSYTSLSDLMDFQWTIAVGENKITAEEFYELTDDYRNIIRYHDTYMILDEKELKKIRRALEKPVSLRALDIMKIHLEGTYDHVPIQTDQSLMDIINSLFTVEPVPVPTGVKAVLRPYQEAGYQWLYHNCKIGIGSLIADDMGLGKTLQVLTLLQKMKEEGSVTAKKPAIVIVPASLASNWGREMDKFTPDLMYSIYHGQDRVLDMESEVMVTTYAVVSQDLSVLAKKRWSAVIIDEAQNIKTPTAARTLAIKSLKGTVKIAMTGTPVENKLMDYWSVLDYLMKNLLGKKSYFKDTYAIPIERYRNQKALDSFKKLTAPFILRRMKTDKSIIQDLPDKITLNTYTELTHEQAALYESLVSSIEEMTEQAEGIQRSGIIFKLISGLKQICDHPALYLKDGKQSCSLSGKTQQLMLLLEKILSQNEKVLIFTQFAQMGHILQSVIKDELHISAPFFYGSLSRKQRDTMIDTFQNDKNCKIMIISLKAGGVGLNLTAANHVIHYDLWWNPAVEHQATDRVFRIGQRKDVQVHRFITKGSFEEKINRMLEEKQELADLTVAQGEKWIASMNTRELKELLKLER